MSVNIYDKQGDKLTQVAGNATGGGSINIDNALSSTSANPVQNQVITNAINTLNSDLETHKINTDIHVTAMEKSAWDNKAELADIPTILPANGGNADTVDNKHASDFMQNLGVLTTGSLLDYVLTMTESGYLFVSNNVTDTPVSGQFFFVDVRRYAGGSYAITATRFNAGGVYTNRYNNNSNMKKWYGWANVADGGNAATVNGKTVNFNFYTDPTQFGKTLNDTANDIWQALPEDSVFITGVNQLEDASWAFPSETQFHVIVMLKHLSVRPAGIFLYPKITGKIYYAMVDGEGNFVSTWYAINDGGNAATVNGLTVQTAVPANAKFTDTTYVAATESVSGLVSTTTQNFAGNKFVQAERVGIRMMGVTKGTIPTKTQIAHIQFQDSSGANADSASLAQIYHQVQNSSGNSVLTLQAVEATTSGSTNRTTLSLMYGPYNKCAYVSDPIVDAGAFCLRNMQSGKLEPVTTAASGKIKVPSGAWYGKHA